MIKNKFDLNHFFYYFLFDRDLERLFLLLITSSELSLELLSLLDILESLEILSLSSSDSISFLTVLTTSPSNIFVLGPLSVLNDY